MSPESIAFCALALTITGCAFLVDPFAAAVTLFVSVGIVVAVNCFTS